MPKRSLSVILIATSASCAAMFGAPRVGGESKPPANGDVSESGPGPQQASDYRANTDERRCAPSCYIPEPTVHLLDPVRGCGYAPYMMREIKSGASSWSKIQFAGGIATQDSLAIPFPCDQFPAPQPAWREELTASRPLLNRVKPADVVVVDPNQNDWEYEHDDHGQVIARDLTVRVYQHDIETRPSPCGDGKDPLLFCEKGRSRVATALNAAQHHLAEAEALAKAGKKNGCRQAAWDVVAYVESARFTRENGIADHNWTPGAHYELRDGRKLDETALFKELDDVGARGKEKFAACGGAGDPPIRDQDRMLDHDALGMQSERYPDGAVRRKMW